MISMSYEIPRKITYKHRYFAPSFNQITRPLDNILLSAPRLESRGNRPLKMDFEDQLNALIFFHLEEHTSARELIQVMKEDDFARNAIAPKGASAEVHFQKRSMNVDLSNFSMFFSNCKNKPLPCYPKNMLTLATLFLKTSL